MRTLRLPPVLLVVGLALVFIGERILGGTGADRWLFTLAGVAVVADAAIWRGLDRRRARDDDRRAASTALLGYLMVLAGLGVYLLTTRALGIGSVEGSLEETALTVLWLVALVTGAPVAILSDWTRARDGKALGVELRRVRAAAGGALVLGLVVSWVFTLNYLADRHDVRWDWSELARVELGDGTQDLLANLSDDIEIVLFYPPASETLERVRPYFDRVDRASDRVRVRYLDHAVEPARARQLGASGNGIIFVTRGNERQSIPLPAEFERARPRLKDLDRDLQEALLKVTYERRTLSMTVGHNERQARRNSPPAEQMTELLEWLSKLNVNVDDLGVQQGLGREITRDAGIVAVIGPTERFHPESVESLRRWYAEGGSLLLLLDPDVEVGLEPLLADLGLVMQPGVVAHERYHLRVSGGPSDRSNVVTNRYDSHPVTRTLAREARRSWLTLDSAGAFRIDRETTPAPQPLVRAMPGAWLDRDGDFHPSAGESLDVDVIAAAATTGRGIEAGRAVVIADSDLISNRWVNTANAQLFGDALAWLARAGDAQLRVTQPRRDPPLVHTRAENLLWFWTTVAGVPLLVLLGGLVLVRRRQRGGRR